VGGRSKVTSTPGNQQERLDDYCVEHGIKSSSRILRGHTPDTERSVKIWSDPRGDTGSQADPETTWPPDRPESIRR
jgi:hypothetical protein